MFQISDFAGNTLTSAKRIDAMSPGTLQGRIEYKGDIDFYGFQASANKTYQFAVAANGTQVSETTLVLKAYRQDGNFVSSVLILKN